MTFDTHNRGAWTRWCGVSKNDFSMLSPRPPPDGGVRPAARGLGETTRDNERQRETGNERQWGHG